MGVLKNGVFGGFIGKVGNLVGYESKGRFMLRAKPKLRTTPPTEGELSNRKKFEMVQRWLGPLTRFLRTGFQNYAETYEGFTAAKSHLMKNALAGEKPNQVIDPAKVLVSFGKLPPPQMARAEFTAERTITISWASKGSYPRFTRVMYLIYIPGDRAIIETAGPPLERGEVQVELHSFYLGKTALVYLAFIQDDRKDRSNSVFLGEIMIPKAKRTKAAKR